MPDLLDPSLELMRRLGLHVPPQLPVNPDEERIRAIYDSNVRQQQAQDPSTFRQVGRNSIDALGGAFKGFLGFDAPEDASGAEYSANALTQLASAANDAVPGFVKAGVPIWMLTNNRPIFHGTQKAFSEFKPELNDASDVLGWMTHGTPDVNYAEGYAMGGHKHLDYDYAMGDQYVNQKPRPNIISMKPEAHNVLDLIDPNPDDLSAALASMNPTEREHYIKLFKNARKDPSGYLSYLDSQHYPKDIKRGLPEDEIAIRVLADKLKLSPEQFEKSPFDAVRYNDTTHESYAIKPGTPIRSAYGAPMTKDPTAVNVFKENSTRPYTGSLEVAPDRWQHTPMNLPDTPKPYATDAEFEEMFKPEASVDYQQWQADQAKKANDIYHKSSYSPVNDVLGNQIKKETFAPGLVSKAESAGLDPGQFNTFSSLSDAYYQKTGSSILSSSMPSPKSLPAGIDADPAAEFYKKFDLDNAFHTNIDINKLKLNGEINDQEAEWLEKHSESLWDHFKNLTDSGPYKPSMNLEKFKKLIGQ